MMRNHKFRRLVNLHTALTIIREQEAIPLTMIVRVMEGNRNLQTASIQELYFNPRFHFLLEMEANSWGYMSVSPNSFEWCLAINVIPA